jgi:hypothetical protein
MSTTMQTDKIPAELKPVAAQLDLTIEESKTYVYWTCRVGSGYVPTVEDAVQEFRNALVRARITPLM